MAKKLEWVRHIMKRVILDLGYKIKLFSTATAFLLVHEYSAIAP
jgi:hypothetical protein